MKASHDLTVSRVQSWLLRKTNLTGVRRVGVLPAAIATEVGEERKENQDRAAVARGVDVAGRPYLLGIVCDGMGGMRDGSTCAAIAAAAFLGSFLKTPYALTTSESRLQQAVSDANGAVFGKYSGAGGTTLSAVLVHSAGLAFWANVGDSRVYFFSDGKLTQLTTDDNIAGQLKHAVAGSLGSDLLQYVGMGKDLQPHVARIDLRAQSSLLLTTDGIHFVGESVIAAIAARAPEPAVCVRRLADVSKWCGGHDNGTAAMLAIPSHATALTTNIDDSVFEVWDAFGELQILLPSSETGASSTANETTSVWQRVADVHDADVVAAEQSRGKRRRRDRKTKAMAEPARAPSKSKRKKRPLPQLKIEFPTKS